MPRIDVLGCSPHGRTWRNVGRHLRARIFVFEAVSRKDAGHLTRVASSSAQ